MPTVSFDDVLGLDDEFDPLMADDLEIDQEDMDDDNPLDTVDYPTMRNMPQSMQREAVYTPKRQGGVESAVLELLDHNPGRRPVLLSIMGLCRGGCAASRVAEHVEAAQASNRSVYAPMTLCRMLERAGALELSMPEPSTAAEDVEAGVEFLQITETIDPVWLSTEEALAVAQSFREGALFDDIVLNRDAQYLEVYRAIMGAVAQAPRSKQWIEELTDTFEIVKHPRRFGGHFIDMLEKTDALAWNGEAWQLTELGKRMLARMNAKGN